MGKEVQRPRDNLLRQSLDRCRWRIRIWIRLTSNIFCIILLVYRLAFTLSPCFSWRWAIVCLVFIGMIMKMPVPKPVEKGVYTPVVMRVSSPCGSRLRGYTRDL